jgi:hypothetical protein
VQQVDLLIGPVQVAEGLGQEHAGLVVGLRAEEVAVTRHGLVEPAEAVQGPAQFPAGVEEVRP